MLSSVGSSLMFMVVRPFNTTVSTLPNPTLDTRMRSPTFALMEKVPSASDLVPALDELFTIDAPETGVLSLEEMTTPL